MRTFGELLEQARNNKNFSKSKLANHISVNESIIRKWENDEANPTFKNVIKLSEVLGVSLNYFAGLSEK